MADYEIAITGTNCRVTMHRAFTAVLVPELQTRLKNELANGVQEITFDLGQTEMLDSSGIGLLIASGNSLSRSQGRIAVVHASAEILRLLRSMRLLARLHVSAAPGQESAQ